MGVVVLVMGIVAASTPPAPAKAVSPDVGAPVLRVTGGSPGSISLAWNGSSSSFFDRYEVDESRAGSLGPWTALASLPNASETTFYWDGLSPSSSYWWKVVEYFLPVGSATSNIVGQVQPPAPALSATLAGPTSAKLTWTNSATYGGSVAFGAYLVEESTNNGSFDVVATITNESATRDVVAGLAPAGSFWFEVATNDRCSGASNCASFSAPSVSKSLDVRLQSPRPLAAAIVHAPTELTSGALGNFRCTGAGGRPPLTFAWSFGAGRTISGRNVTYAFAQAGTYLATCVVYDTFGSEATATANVTVLGTNSNGTGGGAGPPGSGSGDVPGRDASPSSLIGTAVGVFLLLALAAAVAWLGFAVFRRRRAAARSSAPPTGATGAVTPPPPLTDGSGDAPTSSARPPPANLDEMFDELDRSSSSSR